MTRNTPRGTTELLFSHTEGGEGAYVSDQPVPPLVFLAPAWGGGTDEHRSEAAEVPAGDASGQRGTRRRTRR